MCIRDRALAERAAWTRQRQAQVTLLQATHPQVRVVLDAPLQMQRETEALRSAAGQPGPTDLESLMAASAAAWPPGQGPAQGLRFEPGQLTWQVPDWGPAQAERFRELMNLSGWAVEATAGRVVVRPGKAPGAPGSNRP